PLICSHKREPISDMFPTTSVDMFPITIGVENAVLIAIKATRNTWRLAVYWKNEAEAKSEQSILCMPE
ncbi:MAG: hypothetical protein PHV38_06120, partial [Eubacteriales bacterium]|nr:hypothetical protein [Eubacteriales bacterium]